MKLLAAYVRPHRAAEVVRALHAAGFHGLTAYVVHGMSGETATALHGIQPFEPANLPETAKIEVVCEDEAAGDILRMIADAAATGFPGDGIITVQDVEKMARIRDLSVPAKEKGGGK